MCDIVTYCYTVSSAIDIILASVRLGLSVTLCKILALVQDWCNTAKSCNSVTLAGMFLFVRSDTYTVGLDRLATRTAKKTSQGKRELEFFFSQTRVHWF